MGLFDIDVTGTVKGCLSSAKNNINIFERYADSEYRHKTAYVLDIAIGQIEEARNLLNKEIEEQDVPQQKDGS